MLYVEHHHRKSVCTSVGFHSAQYDQYGVVPLAADRAPCVPPADRGVAERPCIRSVSRFGPSVRGVHARKAGREFMPRGTGDSPGDCKFEHRTQPTAVFLPMAQVLLSHTRGRVGGTWQRFQFGDTGSCRPVGGCVASVSLEATPPSIAVDGTPTPSACQDARLCAIEVIEPRQGPSARPAHTGAPSTGPSRIPRSSATFDAAGMDGAVFSLGETRTRTGVTVKARCDPGSSKLSCRCSCTRYVPTPVVSNRASSR